MPRKRKAERRWFNGGDFARQLEKHFANNPWATFKIDGEDYPGWVDSEAKRAAFERAREAAVSGRWRQRCAARTEMLRARLNEWKPWMWDRIFMERPELLDELTVSQRQAFDQAMQAAKAREAAADAKKQFDAKLITLPVSTMPEGK